MAVSVDVITAKAHHIDEIVKDVRAADRAEFYAMSRREPREVMLEGLRFSTKAWTGFVNGVPVCMFGVAPASLLGSAGIPWLVGTNRLVSHQFAFVRRCRGYILEMQADYARLANVVDARNKVAIRWLRWLGFQFHDPIVYGIDKGVFIPFSMERVCHV